MSFTPTQTIIIQQTAQKVNEERQCRLSIFSLTFFLIFIFVYVVNYLCILIFVSIICHQYALCKNIVLPIK